MLAPDAVQRLLEERTILGRRVGEQREQLDRLRRITESLADRVEADERLLEELDGALGASPQLRLEALSEHLRGQRLAEIAVAILREEAGDKAVVHYRDWFEMLRSRGLRVAGKNPLSTFLTQINRSGSIEQVGRRSGRYRLIRPRDLTPNAEHAERDVSLGRLVDGLAGAATASTPA